MQYVKRSSILVNRSSFYSACLALATFLILLPHIVKADGIYFHDAELEANAQLKFFVSGELREGILRSDFVSDGITFDAGTKIRFFLHGGVEHGTAKYDFSIDGLSFGAGRIGFSYPGVPSSGLVKGGQRIDGTNLVIPKLMNVRFASDGNVHFVGALAADYTLLGMRVFGETELWYDAKQREYSIRSGVTGSATLVASVVLENNISNGQPELVAPVIIPEKAKFRLNSSNPGESIDIDTWQSPSDFKLFTIDSHGNRDLLVNFGRGATAGTLKGKLHYVKALVEIDIEGVKYPPNTLIFISSPGVVFKP